MPASTISAMLPRLGSRTVGSKYQMMGSASTTTSAVNSTMMATFESLKKRSTRYLSKCTEMAHSTGPQKAKKSQDIVATVASMQRSLHPPLQGEGRPRSGRGGEV